MYVLNFQDIKNLIQVCLHSGLTLSLFQGSRPCFTLTVCGDVPFFMRTTLKLAGL